MLDAAPGPVPSYGSREWLALPEGDRAKVAAVVRAAEAWAREGDELVQPLHQELEAERRAHKRAEDRDYAARAAEHRQRWAHLASGRVRGRYAGQAPRPLEVIGAEAMGRAPLAWQEARGRPMRMHDPTCPGCEVEPGLRGVPGVECRPTGGV